MINHHNRVTQDLTLAPQGITSFSYYDSVEIQQRRYYRSAFLCFMKENCGASVGPRSIDLGDGRSIQSLWLHQPSWEAINYLAGKPCKITRVQVALDLLPETEAAAKDLQEYLSRTFLYSNAPFDRVTWVGDPHDPFAAKSCYFGHSKPRGPGTTATLYADKASKVTGAACCHIETRIELHQALKAYALEDGFDLLHLDHSKFWNNRLHLVLPPTAEALGEEWVKAFMQRKGKVTRRFPYGGRTEATRRIGHLLLRAAQDMHGYTNANDILHFLKSRKPLGDQPIMKLFQRLDNSWALPPSCNALWKNDKVEGNQHVRSDIATSSPLSLVERDIPY